MFMLTLPRLDFACYTRKSRRASDRTHGHLGGPIIPQLATWTVETRAASWVC